MTLIRWFLFVVCASECPPRSAVDSWRQCCQCRRVVPVTCDSLWKCQGLLGMFTKHDKAPERCHHPSHRGCKKKKAPPHTPWKYLMNCPLVRKCFGIVFFYFMLFHFCYGLMRDLGDDILDQIIKITINILNKFCRFVYVNIDIEFNLITG